MKRFPRASAALLVVCSSVVLASCGGAGTTVAAEPISFEQLAQAATTSADARSGRFAFSFEMDLPETDEPFAFAGEGAFDAAANRAELSFDFSSFAKLLGGMFAGLAGSGAKGPDLGDPSAWKIDAVQDGQVVYMRFPAVASELPAGKSWVRADVGAAARAYGFDFGQLEDLTQNDPREALELLRAAATEIETVGTEELRGVMTTRYRATVDLAQYEKLAPAIEREQLGSTFDDMLDQAGLGTVPVDVWLDEHGFVRQLTMSLSATHPGSTEKVDAFVKFELWDYGKALDLELPPEAQVVDAASLD